MNQHNHPKYNRDFLSWKEKDFQTKSSHYNPKYHIFANQGLLNDPNCIFYWQNQLHIFFQHHPANIEHGLKTMSLATINANSPKINYQFLVNQPDQSFDSHGTYSGNAWIDDEEIILAYTGNHRDANWNRISSVVLATFNPETQKIENKKVLFNHLDFNDYTEHFRDPFLFKKDDSFYLLLGAQNKNEKGLILMFELNQTLDQAKLIKEIHLNDVYRMIECPAIAWFDEKAVLIYSPQLKLNQLDSKQNPDLVRYTVIDNWKNLLNDDGLQITLSEEKILDYGLEFYAPQTFLINDQWHLIGWSGIPTSLNYPEAKYGWIFCLSMIKKLELINQTLILQEAPYLKELYQQDLDPLIKYYDFDLSKNEILSFLDQDELKLEIQFKNNQIWIERFNDQTFYPYQSLVKIDCLVKDWNNLKIYFDHSIIEIKINETKWYTSRIYFDKQIDFIVKNQDE